MFYNKITVTIMGMFGAGTANFDQVSDVSYKRCQVSHTYYYSDGFIAEAVSTDGPPQ